MEPRSNLESRIGGALLGLACGDALGAPAEFHDQRYVREQWGVLREMTGGGIWKPGEWTDDTGMALCLTEAILEAPDDPVPGAGTRFLQWQRTAKDVGSTISAVLSSFRGDWPEASRNSPQARAGKAAGNGSLMRTLPVALAYPDPDEMLRQSARLSAMTHWDPQAEVCCALYNLWVRRLLAGEERLPSWKAAVTDTQRWAAQRVLLGGTPGPAPLPPGFWERLECVSRLHYDELQPSGYAGYVVECLEAAIWCVLHAESLEDAIVQAVNLAGEADTIAAVAGGAAGAFWGKDAIPSRWLEALHERERLEDLCDQLTTLRAHLEVYTQAGLPRFSFDRVTERLLVGRNPLTARDVEQLRAAGVTHLLDLREEWEWLVPRHGAAALPALETAGIQRLHLPVPDTTPPSSAQFAAACAFIDAALCQPGAQVYVHCRAGQGRTGAVVLAHAARGATESGQALRILQRACSRLQPLSNQVRAVDKWLAMQNGAEE